MPKGPVFISHCKEDKRFAKSLREKLQAFKVGTWLSLDDLPARKDWATQIDRALRNASALIVIISKKAKRSEYVAYEWAFALGAGTKVVPVLKERVGSLHPRLAKIQFVDFTESGKPLLRLIDALPIVSDQGEQEGEPTIVAKFETEDGSPRCIGKEFAISLWLEGFPKNASSVTYKVNDKSFAKPVWSESNKKENFLTSMSSYGDVLLTAKIKTPAAQLNTSATLFEALKRTHSKDRSVAIRNALAYIHGH